MYLFCSKLKNSANPFITCSSLMCKVTANLNCTLPFRVSVVLMLKLPSPNFFLSFAVCPPHVKCGRA